MYSFSGIFWISTWFILNISLTILNKYIMVFNSFPFPLTISLSHMIITSILSLLSFNLITKEKIKPEFSQEKLMKLFLMSTLFLSSISLGNTSLKYVSVSFNQVIRATTPAITLFLSVIILKKKFTPSHYRSVFIVIIGVILSSFTEFDFHWIGFLLTLFVSFLSSLKSIITAKLLWDPNVGFHPLYFLFTISFFASIQLFIIIFLTGEAKLVFIHFLNVHNPFQIVFSLLLSSLIAFLLNFSNFMSTKTTSPLTVNIFGNLKQVFTIILSVLIFENKISFLNAFGSFCAILGCFWYSLIGKLNEKKLPTVEMKNY
ncbi:solute carrier family 35 member e4 [Anaeramoeba ignava]|uniref:Solute carrier family 35 member e4 n=1 Tax=Anaeramoeba ignava TaxID=1746090 RepID=A0A9Q0R4Q6_ANAIG|nr:solute carrier family 35 member e4 [Anaeramoeba ignava]